MNERAFLRPYQVSLALAAAEAVFRVHYIPAATAQPGPANLGIAEEMVSTIRI